MRRLLDDLGRLLHLVDGEIAAAGEVDEDAPGPFDGGLVEQRARDGLLRGVERAVLALARARAHERHAHAGHDGAHVGEVEVDEAGHEDEIRDALHRLEQHGVGDLERLHQRRAAVHHGEEALVGDADEGIHHRAQLGQARLGLLLPPAPLEVEGLGHHRHREDAQILRHRGHHRGRAGAGAAPEPRGDEDHVGAFQHLADLVAVFLGGALPHLGIGAGPEPTGELGAELDLVGRGRGAQRLEVRVGDDELDAGEACRHHPVHGIGAAAAEADHLDLGDFTLLVDLEHRAPSASLLHPRLLVLGHG